MDGTIFMLTFRHTVPKEGELRSIPSVLIGFNDLPENIPLTAEIALDYFKSARKNYKLIRGKEFSMILLGRYFHIDRHGNNFTIYELKEMKRDALGQDDGIG